MPIIQKGYLNNQKRILLLKSSLTKMCKANRKHIHIHTHTHTHTHLPVNMKLKLICQQLVIQQGGCSTSEFDIKTTLLTDYHSTWGC